MVAEFNKKGIYINLYKFIFLDHNDLLKFMESHIFFHFEEIKANEFQELGEGPKHISEDCIQQCAMLCLNIPGTH